MDLTRFVMDLTSTGRTTVLAVISGQISVTYTLGSADIVLGTYTVKSPPLHR